MSAKSLSVISSGMTGIVIDVECQLSKGLPSMTIVGIASKAVDESKERIRSAFINSNLAFPRKRITINLAPGDIPKDGTGIDLAIASAILFASEQVHFDPADSVFIGELGLEGAVRPVRGIIGKILRAKESGIKQCFIPYANLKQASLIEGITLYPISSLQELYLHLTGTEVLTSSKLNYFEEQTIPNTNTIDICEVAGQVTAKRALEIAATGGHNVLLSGPPGTGKSMLAKAFRGLLPPLSLTEAIEVTQLHSLAGIDVESMITLRPFRSPHHTASNTSIVGGGQYPRPGEISLSHRGVLFLDELPEFHRATIEALRQPLEDRVITIARSRGNIEFPANFMLIATANPCPCGYYGTATECSCPASLIERYQRKLSGPIIDRIDMFIPVHEINHAELLQVTHSQETSSTIRKRVEQARVVQESRFGNPLELNAQMNNKQIRKMALLSSSATDLLNTASEKLRISARNYMRIIKVARTIADLDSSPTIEVAHMSEALQYRHKQAELSRISA